MLRGNTMPIPMTCPNCQSTGLLPDTLLGRRVKCPSCGTVTTAEIMTAPPLEVVPAAEDEGVPPREAPTSRTTRPFVLVAMGVSVALLAFVAWSLVNRPGGTTD